MTTVTTHSESETRRVAQRLARHLAPGDVVALEGGLGAGKTCFVRGLAEGLGLDPGEVSSPTFVLCQEYGPDAGAPTLVHLDAYRLGGPDELDTIGWDELLESGDAVIAVEWADRIGPRLPAARVTVALVHAGENERRITLTATPALAERLGIAGPDAPACGRRLPPEPRGD